MKDDQGTESAFDIVEDAAGNIKLALAKKPTEPEEIKADADRPFREGPIQLIAVKVIHDDLGPAWLAFDPDFIPPDSSPVMPIYEIVKRGDMSWEEAVELGERHRVKLQ